MFNQNQISCTEKEILDLFFSEKKIPIGEIPGLDFFNFMSFALSKKADQDFRNFMRSVKEKTQEEKRILSAKRKENEIEKQ